MCDTHGSKQPMQADQEIEELPTMEVLLGHHVDMRAVRKIGEGTFGEAFKVRTRSLTQRAQVHTYCRVFPFAARPHMN